MHVLCAVQVSESDEAALMKRVKALWRARMLAPPSQDKLSELLAEVRNEQKVNSFDCTITYFDMKAKVTVATDHAYVDRRLFQSQQPGAHIAVYLCITCCTANYVSAVADAANIWTFRLQRP